MTTAEPAALQVTELPVEVLEPNPWNPNRMTAETRAKLVAYLRSEGLVQPLVVRRLPGKKERYQILGGQHRWEICKDELGWAAVPCVVVDVDEQRARIMTVNLNELSGDAAPHLMAELVHDLSRDATLSDLATTLPYSERELADLQELLKVPSGLALELEQDIQRHRDGTPTPMTFLVDEPAPVEDALRRVAEGMTGKNLRGRGLVDICRAWLDAQPESPGPAE